MARAFADAGFSLYAVGGSVRDAILGEERGEDFEIDFTTNARPDDIVALMTPLCTTLWEQGRDFGTVGGVLRGSGIKVEITTFRSEAYVDHSRKPAVEWGDSLEADLSRRDFTINALALDVDRPGRRRHRTCRPSSTSTTDSTTCTSGFCARRSIPRSSSVTTPCGCCAPRASPRGSRSSSIPRSRPRPIKMADRLTKVSPERIRGELDLLMVTATPSVGLDFIVRTGLAEVFFPELPKLQLEQDPIHRHKDVLAHTWAVVDKTSPDLVLRLAALFHDIGKPTTRAITEDGVTFRFHEVVGAKMTRKRMTALRYSQEMIDDVSALVELHLRFHTYKLGWSDKAVRRYVRDAGPLLDELNELTRCDCTTRNARKAAELAERMDELEIRIADLREREDLERLRPALDGVAVMELLNIAPSPAVGRALEFLMEIRLDEGEITPQEAAVRLREWWADQA